MIENRYTSASGSDMSEKVSSSRVAVLLFFLLLIAAPALWLGLSQPPDLDEPAFHLPAIQQYIDQFPAFDLQHYHSASGPVPYMLWSVWGQLFGDSLPALRLLSLLLGLGCVVILWRVLRDEPTGRTALLLGLIVLQPYFLYRCYTIYTMIPALVTALLALAFYLRFERKKEYSSLLVFALFASLAVCSRQVYLSYVAGVLAHFTLFHLLPSWRKDRGRSLAQGALLMLPVFALLGLFWLWGGSNPPDFRENAVRGINWRMLDFVPLFLGFWFLPVAWTLARRVSPVLWLLAAVASLHLIFWPYIADPVGIEAGNVSGVIAKLFLKAASKGLPLWLLGLAQAALWSAGVIVLAALLYRLKHVGSWIAFAHFGLLAFIPHTWERFFLPVIPILWLSLRDTVKARPIFLLWLVFQALLTAMYVAQKSGVFGGASF